MSGLRAVATDIDGTLIDSWRKRVPDFTASELRRVVREYGVHPILITARGPQSTALIEEQLGVQASFVCFGGALVQARTAAGAFETISAVALEPADVGAFVNAAGRYGIHSGLYTRDAWYVDALDYWGLREARNTSIWPSVVPLPEILRDAAEEPFHKVMFRGDPEPLARLAEELKGLTADVYVHHMPRVIEIFPARAVKLPALDLLAAHLGFGLDEVIAFGDSASDLEMLEHAGVGVLMANSGDGVTASERVERTLSNDEDGVGIALRKHFPTAEPFRP